MFISALSSELGDKMALGGKVALMGILVVFVLLILIVLILQIIDAINKKTADKPKKEWKFHKKSKITEENGEIADAPKIVVADEINNDATVAAITAALSLVLQSENSNSDALFVVKKITKINYRR